MATIGNYGVYEALLQTPVEGPEFADVNTYSYEHVLHYLN